MATSTKMAEENNASDTQTDGVPYRGFAQDPGLNAPPTTPVVSYPSPTPVKHVPMTLRTRLMNLLSPRQTDMNQLIRKLEVQFEELQREVLKYQYEKKSEKEPSEDSNHPVNSPEISHEVHFVGRSALDPTINQLSTFLISHDMFGCITELWLSNNQISDAGAESLSRYLEMPRCPIVELWLGQNNIGPNGVTFIAAALSSNTKSKLKCLGLDRNPIKNAGAGCLAQMLRGNHSLITVAVHGCMYDGNNDGDVEGYGCKVVKMSDGKEYVARVDTSAPEEREGYVTDQRLLDAITTFSTFNKINPTREQAIRGLMLRNKRAKAATAKASQESGVTNANTEEEETMVTSFLSHLEALPPTAHLTDEEKRIWKDCEWEMFYVEIERARVARSALADRLEIRESDSVEKFGDDGNDKTDNTEENEVEEEILGGLGGEKQERLGRDLDDEVVRTEKRQLRDLKMGIAGSPRVAGGKSKSVKKEEAAAQKPDDAPQNPFRDAAVSNDQTHDETAETTSHDEVDLKTAPEDQLDSNDVKFV